jgi:hypothetical protein
MKNSLFLIATALLFLATGLYLGSTLSRQSTPENPCPGAEAFQPFLKHFNDDIRFQQERTLFPLYYVTWSDTGLPATDTLLIEKHNWIPLNLFDSSGTIATIFNPLIPNPGRKNFPDSIPDPCRFTVTLEGIHHDQQMTLHFTLKDNLWHLDTFEDYSL